MGPGNYKPRYKCIVMGILVLLLLCSFVFRSNDVKNVFIQETSEVNVPEVKESQIYHHVANKEKQIFAFTNSRGKNINKIDYKKETARISHTGTKMDDPWLIQLIREHWIRPPPTGPYRFKNKREDYSTDEQSIIIDEAMNKKEGGFFVECGACDGEFQSNTLYLELKRKWTGLLIEPNRENYRQLLRTNRHAYSINACLSPTNHPSVVNFQENWALGHIQPTKGAKTVEVQCFPIYSILLALNITHIDVFSLDVEGLEAEILSTIPMDKVDVTIFNVEYKHVKGGAEFLQHYMENRGYAVVKKVFRDQIFKKSE